VLVAVPLAAALRGVLTAELAYAALGHALTPEHLVSQHGAYTLAREALERDGIIGWVLRQSLFQRRAGLATLVATTAAGSERVEIVDVPLGAAVALAGAATPAVLEGFIERSSAPG
jgi:putative membrane protein